MFDWLRELLDTETVQTLRNEKMRYVREANKKTILVEELKKDLESYKEYVLDLEKNNEELREQNKYLKKVVKLQETNVENTVTMLEESLNILKKYKHGMKMEKAEEEFIEKVKPPTIVKAPEPITLNEARYK